MAELFGVKYDSEEKKPKKPLISRRGFLRGSAVAGAVAVAGVTLPSAVDVAQEKIQPEKLKREIEKKVSFIKNKYDISISGTHLMEKETKLLRDTLNILGNVEEEDASLSKIDRALNYIIEEFSKYPAFFIKNLHIPFINISDTLVAENHSSTTGVTFQKGVKNYIDLEISSGFLNKDKSFGWNEQKPFLNTIHHELFHVVNNTVDDSQHGFLSAGWVGLYDRKDFKGKISKDKPGFISEYGQTSSKEDFADTASAMMNCAKDIWEKIKKDKKLKAKTNFLQKLMFETTLGLMNQEYWDFLQKGKIPPDFFQKRKEYLISLDFNQFKKELRSHNGGNRILIDEESKGFLTEEGVFKLYKEHLTESEI